MHCGSILKTKTKTLPRLYSVAVVPSMTKVPLHRARLVSESHEE